MYLLKQKKLKQHATHFKLNMLLLIFVPLTNNFMSVMNKNKVINVHDGGVGDVAFANIIHEHSIKHSLNAVFPKDPLIR